MPAYHIHQLNYQYQLGEKIYPVLNNVNLKIEHGEMVAITGSSGSGKSTLLYLLAGMLHCQPNQIYLDSMDIAMLSRNELSTIRNRKLGYIFQQFHLLPNATVLENILLPAQYCMRQDVDEQYFTKKAHTLAKKLGLADKLACRPHQLSGGEQQRTAIARALINDADIILADEPTGNLDSYNTQQILAILKQLNAEGCTVIIITHEADVAQQVDRVVELKDGQIVNDTYQHKVVSTAKRPLVKKQRMERLGLSAKLKQLCRLVPLAWGNLARKKTQSLLTMLGITIGIIAMLALITLGQFAEAKILKSYEALGAKTVAIWGIPNRRLSAADRLSLMFNGFSYRDDLQFLPEIFPSVVKFSPVINIGGSTVTYGGHAISEQVRLMGVNGDYLTIVGRKLALGRNITPYDVTNFLPVCIIGRQIQQQLFATQDPINSIIYLQIGEQSTSCHVIGVLAAQQAGSESQFSNPNMQIIMPYTFTKSIGLNIYQTEINRVLLSVTHVSQVRRVAIAIQHYYQHKYGKSGIFIVDPNLLLLSQMRKFLTIFTLILGAIAVISLIVGGIGITNMMLASIAERLKEIGIRKALGASEQNIKYLLLTESTLLCVLAGIVGIVIGFIIYQLIIYFASLFIRQIQFEWVFSLTAILLSFVSMIVIGIISGMVPAVKAAKLEIVSCLRSEE